MKAMENDPIINIREWSFVILPLLFENFLLVCCCDDLYSGRYGAGKSDASLSLPALPMK